MNRSPSTDTTVITADEIIRTLDQPHQASPSGTLRAAAERWHFVRDPLLARVDAEITEIRKGLRREYSDVTVYTLYLAAEKNASDAFPILVRLLSVEDPRTMERFGEVFTDDMPVILADCYPGSAALPEMEAIVSNPSLAVACRRAVLNAWEILAWQQRIGSPKLRTILKNLAQGTLSSDQPRLWTAFTEVCLAGGLHDFESLVLQAHEQGWIDPVAIPSHVLHQAFDQVRTGTYQPFSSPVTIESAAAEVEQWNWDQAEETAPISLRTGRNDLCPCGSGKKFKRCCMGSG